MSIVGQKAWFMLHESHVPPSFDHCSDENRAILEEIRENSFCVKPNFVSAEFCQKCIEEFERLTREFPSYVHHGEDQRLFGVEHVSTHIRQYSNDASLFELANAYTGYRNSLFCTLANKIFYRPEQKLGSGGDWHRDVFMPEIKTILYLSDVGEDNGPFQILAGSHVRSRIIEDMKLADLRFLQNRVDNQANLLIEHDPSRFKSLTGKAGTLLLFDASAIHRGAPLRSGVRYALTNYIGDKSLITPQLYEKYAPIFRDTTTLAR